MDSNIGRNIDRISNLPDCLLCHILSFLPTKYAVGTSILSPRWRNIWTSVPILDIDEFEAFQEYSELSEDRQERIDLTFSLFVGRALVLNDAPYLQKFHLNVGTPGQLEFVDKWICCAITRNVRDLELHNLIEDKVLLPHCLFTSETLVVLTLYGAVLDVPESTWLPNLKILKLQSVEYDNEHLLEYLFSGCPVLEELKIENWITDSQRVLTVSSVPTLKRLSIVCCTDDSDFLQDESVDHGCKLVVDAPQLEYFYLADYVLEDILFRNLSSLSKALFCVGPTCLGPDSFSDDGIHTYKLLSGIPNVKFLDAILSFQTDVNNYTLPTFNNLTQLKFGADVDSSWNLRLLADFLQCSPNLEVLILKGSSPNDSAKSWNPPQEVPSCLVSHLKKVEFENFSGKDDELDVIEYLLKNATVLKKMTIDCRYSDNCFCGKLAAFSRGSKASQLNLIL